jgi:hypothetical protein
VTNARLDKIDLQGEILRRPAQSFGLSAKFSIELIVMNAYTKYSPIRTSGLLK